jgi:hypothetical protein
MGDSEDTWPLPKYNPGAHKHLHALGVIAITFAAFERSIDSLYDFHPRQQKLPDELVSLYYFSLNEEKRINAVREIFSAYEKDSSVKAAVSNVLDYFKWCRHTRNQLLHSEHYPALFGGDPDTLYLTKRIGKQSPKSGYMAFHLSRLRSIADKIRVGVVQCGEIHIYLRVRDVPADSLPVSLRIYKHEPLPQTLRIPRLLKLSPRPHTPPPPAHLRRSSPR